VRSSRGRVEPVRATVRGTGEPVRDGGSVPQVCQLTARVTAAASRSTDPTTVVS
jgi:hypothetical protein